MTPARARPAGRRRTATSLIELLASITLSVALVGTATTLLALLLRVDRLGRDELAATLAVARLASDLRDDVSASVRAETPGGPDGPLDLEFPGGATASYRFDGRALVRRLDGGAGPGRIESYRFPAGTSARWEGDGRRVALVLRVPATPKAAGGVALRIEATAGRDHRFEGWDPLESTCRHASLSIL